MKLRHALLCLLCLSLLIACQSPPPTRTREPIPAPGISVSTRLLPTRAPTNTPVLPPSPTAVTTPPTITPTPFVSVQALASRPMPGSAWTYWPAIDQSPGAQAVTTNGDAIWAGTSSGVYRIDPRTGAYTGYGEINPNKQLLSLEDGTLWATGANGVFYFDGQRWHRLIGLKADSLAIDVNGDLWLLQYNDRFGGTTAIHFAGHAPPSTAAWSYERYTPDQQPPWPSADLTNCNAWAASYAHRTQRECQALQAARSAAFLPGSVLPYFTAIDRDGSVWWITDRTLHHHHEDSTSDQKLPSANVESTTTSQELPVSRVTSITPDPERGVWLGTDRGLFYSDGVTLRSLLLEQNQYTLRAKPRNIAVDTQGNAWIVTAQGVQMLPAAGTQWQDVTDFNLGPGIKHWPLGTIATAQEGGIWATHGGDLWRFGGSTTTPLTDSVPLGEYCRLIHLTVDRDGNVWSPLGVCGVAVFKPQIGQWVLYPSNHDNDPLDYSGTVWGLFIDGAGVVYARGDSNQLHRFVALASSSGTLSQTWQPVAQPSGQLVLGADAQDGQWTVDCRTGEVWRERAGSVTAFGKVFTALPGSDCNYSYRWYFDARSWLWVYDGVDLLHFNGQAWQSAQQPEVGYIQDMTTGPDGRVWIVGDRGVAVYDSTHAP